MSATAREGPLLAAPHHVPAPPATLPFVSGGPRHDDPVPEEAASDPMADTEDDVDEASEESFPASDAPASWSGPPDS